MKNGNDYEGIKKIIESELPDVIIYGCVLAYHYDVDLYKLVNEKAEVVVQRALEGYYGGPLKR